ncbi:hypothetical protein ACFL04_02115 [Patescibacteria group bacterium]
MNEKRLDLIIGSVVIAVVLLLIGIYTFSTNIYGDAQYHKIVTETILDQGWPLPDNPYIALKFDANDQAINAPINYPEAAYLLYAGILWLGGDILLQASSLLFASLSALLIFLILKPIDRRLAALAAVLAVIFNLKRFIMSPIIEQPLLTAMLATIYFFIQWTRSGKWLYIFLTALSGGLAMSLKQQGLLILPLLLIIIIMFGLIKYIRNKDNFWRQSIVLLILMMVITLPFQLEHLNRNGTIGYVPGSGTSGVLDKIPYYQNITNNKYPADEEARDIQSSRLGYLRSYPSLTSVMLAYLSFPFTFDNTLPLDEWNLIGSLIILVLILLGFYYISRKNIKLGIIVLVMLTGEILFTYFTDTAIWQYHIFGVSLLIMILTSGIIYLLIILTKLRKPQIINLSVILLIIFIFTHTFITQFHQPFYANSGRQDSESLEVYRHLGEYVSNNLPNDTIVMTASTNFVDYARYRRFWISNGGGADIPEIFATNNANQAYNLIKQYPINYLLIDERQTARQGLYDSIPINGLSNIIDTPEGQKYFNKLYKVTRPDGLSLRLYELVEPLVDTTSL